MAYDAEARYDGDRDVVVFRVVDGGGTLRRAAVSAEALADHFHCHESGPALLACYQVHWQRIHDAAVRIAAREADVLIGTSDL